MGYTDNTSSPRVSRGIAYVAANGYSNTRVAGNWYNWCLNAGNPVAAELVDFTHSGGVLTYTGSEEKVFKVLASVYMRGSLGVGQGNHILGISVNGAAPDLKNQCGVRLTSTASTATVTGVVTLSTGDTVSLQSLANAGSAFGTYAYYDWRSNLIVTE